MTDTCNGLRDFIPTESIQWDSSWPKSLESDARHRLLSYLEGRFGIPPRTFRDYLLFQRKNSWWLLRDTRQIAFASRLKVSQVGMKAFQRVGAYIKPATRMIQSFGHNASRARVDLNKHEVLRLLAGEPLPTSVDIDEGYVILSLRKNWILGLGLLVNGSIHSQLPRKTLRPDMLQTAEYRKDRVESELFS